MAELSEREMRAEVFEAAADGLAEFSGSLVTCEEYENWKAYDAAFEAATEAIKNLPVDEVPEDLAKEVDELCSLVNTEPTLQVAEDSLREAAEDARR